MKKVAISYADERYKLQQRYNTKTAYRKGKFDQVIEYSPSDVDEQFKRDNKEILSQSRGGGYWLWKPYIIKKTLEQLQDGDYLFYCDAGAFYIKNINYLIKEMEKRKESIMLFELALIEKEWNKRDALILMACDSSPFYDTNQVLATCMLLKKNSETLEFIDQYLSWCQDPRILTDMKNTQGLDNHIEFIDHRHDQSVLSLLSKKHHIKPYRDPSQWGFAKGYDNSKGISRRYRDTTYPQILVSCRGSNPRTFLITSKLTVVITQVKKYCPNTVKIIKKVRDIVLR